MNQSLCLTLLKFEKYSLKSRPALAFLHFVPMQRLRLTVKHRLAQCHDGCCEANEQRTVALLPANLTTAGQPRDPSLIANVQTSSSRRRNAMVIDDHDVQAVKDCFHGIERALRAAKTIVALPSGPSVNVVNRGVDLIRFPNGPLQEASSHCMRTQ